jgi:hypothetical protein
MAELNLESVMTVEIFRPKGAIQGSPGQRPGKNNPPQARALKGRPKAQFNPTYVALLNAF